MITYEQLRHDPTVNTYIEHADRTLAAQGYTEHSYAHVVHVAETAGHILKELGATPHEIELARIAAYLHDIGNLINRVDHSQSGAIMAFRLLERYGMPAEDVCIVAGAIGNHDESTGVPVDHISAALILADKSDVRRSRVRNASPTTFDIHDRVNYSVTERTLTINEQKTQITLSLTVDPQYGSIMEYFEIFMERMLLCRRAAERLGLLFHLQINGQRLL